MKINYKFTTIALLVLLIISFAFPWFGMGMGRDNMMSGNTHRMSNGSMMANDHMDMGGMMMDMSANMKGKSGKELEKVFLTDMIPHHQGAVDMAKLLLADPAVTPELKMFASNIIKAQESEITQMKVWLSKY